MKVLSSVLVLSSLAMAQGQSDMPSDVPSPVPAAMSDVPSAVPVALNSAVPTVVPQEPSGGAMTCAIAIATSRCGSLMSGDSAPTESCACYNFCGPDLIGCRDFTDGQSIQIPSDCPDFNEVTAGCTDADRSLSGSTSAAASWPETLWLAVAVGTWVLLLA